MRYDFDPELVPGLASLPIVDPTDVAAARALTAAMVESIEPSLDRSDTRVSERLAPSSWDSHQIPLRVLEPAIPGRDRPVILSIHGGGYTSGAAKGSDPESLQLVSEVGAVVVAVEYRLAPEHPYPAGLEDCYSALEWVVEHADELGVDPTRVAVLGQSAGAGLAAGLALLARDRQGPRIAFQYLGVPAIDDTLETPSMLSYVDTPRWSRPRAIFSWQCYLGTLHGSDDIPIYAAPARASVSDLVNLPATYVAAMQYDPLRDEGIVFAAKLAQAGVPTELHLFPQTYHVSFADGSAAVSQQEIAEKVRVLRRALSDGKVRGSLLVQVEANPREYYVNVHTPTFPGGEIRGQLK